MIDPLLTLSFSVQSRKGVYALLLGSGISSSAGIPTGWEISLDIIKQLAVLENEECKPDPMVWYTRKYGKAPDYSSILDRLTQTSGERTNLLKRYFEPTEEEQGQELKLPTKAHKAIAQIVAKGYIRVILTTNFDRLLEQAFNEQGIHPFVISTVDQIKGSIPLVHSDCTIIKVHGDYLDTRIKNTESELSEYDPELNQYLDRIFDEYGLIICGWSAEFDHALRRAIERCPNKRFPTYWTTLGKISERAEKLIKHKDAQVIKIQDADTFFFELVEKIESLEEIELQPESPKIAVTRLKRYLSENQEIYVHDLVLGEAGLLIERIRNEIIPGDSNPLPADTDLQEFLESKLQLYESWVESLQALAATGCYWRDNKFDYIWVKCLEYISLPKERFEASIWKLLQRYPPLILYYTMGIICLERRNNDLLFKLLSQPKGKFGGEEILLVDIVNTSSVFEEKKIKFPKIKNRYAYLSDHIHSVIKTPLTDFIPDNQRLEFLFDRFEYILALFTYDHRKEIGQPPWGPIGSFGWRNGRFPKKRIFHTSELELSQFGENWEFLKAGFFGGSLERLKSVKEDFDKWVLSFHWK